MIEDDYLFTCPNCGVELSARLDATAGRQQQYVQDCEVCCRPIQIRLEFDGEAIAFFSAEACD